MNNSHLEERTIDNTRYGTTPKGIAGEFGSIDQVFNLNKPTFAINIQDPLEKMNYEINEKYVKPRLEFDLIF